MSKNKNTITRIMILDKLLSDQYHEYSVNDLTEIINEELSDSGLEDNNVTRRTIEKDIEYIEKSSPWMADINRWWTTGYNKELDKTVVYNTVLEFMQRDPYDSLLEEVNSLKNKYLSSRILVALSILIKKSKSAFHFLSFFPIRKSLILAFLHISSNCSTVNSFKNLSIAFSLLSVSF